MLKKALFQVHGLFGITAGLVLAFMGITGAMVSFQDELLRLLNPSVLQLEVPPHAEALPPAELVRRLEAREGKRVAMLWVEPHGDSAARVAFTPPPGERRGPMRYFNPYTADYLGEARGQDFFGLMLQLHRVLALGESGRQITGACTLMLVFFCLSGLYLRWPRQAGNWRAWLTFDWAKSGRAFNWNLHAVAGTWCLLLYLLSALTGLFWSYEWYSNGLNRWLADSPLQQRGNGPRKPPPAGPPPSADYTALWASLQQVAGPDLSAYNIRLPAMTGQPATVYYLLKDAPHPRALNQINLDPDTGAIREQLRYADQSFKAQLLTSVYALHVGSYFGLTGRVLLTLSSLGLPLFCITGWLLYLDRRRKQQQVKRARQELMPQPGDTPAWLIGFASQSGFAEQLAWHSATQLQAAGLSVRVRSMAEIHEQDLREATQALFVVSTFGDGEAPDSARGFERKVVGQPLSLDRLNYSLLALGDRQYPHFCGFARRLHHWLEARGGTPLFAPVEVDNGDPQALRDWQRQLNRLTGSTSAQAWSTAAFTHWTLRQRDLLNPDSAGSAVYLLSLTPTTPTAWQAGDRVEVLPRQSALAVQAFLAGLGLAAGSPVQLDGLRQSLAHALGTRQLPESRAHLIGLQAQALVDALIPLSPREYSIASIESDGQLQLLVRQQRHADGRLGLGSGWLTEHAPPGSGISLRVRRNSGFHLPSAPCPLILLGNGTGLAGLRSLLKARIAEGQHDNWLLFGERNSAHDFHCAHELQGWLAGGELARLDLAFSRDQGQKIYVQDRLREAADELRKWLAAGAALYICGSLRGMAAGVDQVLLDVLGAEAVEELIEQGRYRRDVY